MKIKLPELALVLLIGPSGSGKSSFARRHFRATEILSSDTCRGWVSDDENNQSATSDAFDVLHYIADKRLANGLLTVIDATNVQREARKTFLDLARSRHCFAVAIVFDLPEALCLARNRERPDRNFGPHVVRGQRSHMLRGLRGLEKEGFRYVNVLKSVDEVDAVEIVRTPLWSNLKHETGPFDIIGDVHGCFDELTALLDKLGYQIDDRDAGFALTHPQGRRPIFLGDLVDRGPATPDVVRLVKRAVTDGIAICVAGNHDNKLARALSGRQVKIAHGLEQSLAQLETETPEFRKETEDFLDSLRSHYVLDGGKLVVAHAGLKADMQGRSSGAVRAFCLYGETTGEIDEYGLPVRHPWAEDYRGRAMVVYGHTPAPRAEWLNNTLCIDTGCVFGGSLTALRYPERELVSVPAARVYCEPSRPFLNASARDLNAPVRDDDKNAERTIQHAADDDLDLADVTGKRMIHTRLRHSVTLQAENTAAALEVMSRFGADPRWLVYLPPTMSPSETSQRPGFLEHPDEAFAYYRAQGVERVVCEEKHMGSRAIVAICRDANAARARFGVADGSDGLVYTRTGRPFFTDAALHAAFLGRLRNALDAVDFWREFDTDWFVFDCELMPWSAKAQQLIREQYAGTGVAGRAMLAHANALIAQAVEQGRDVAALQSQFAARAEQVNDYVTAYRRYCWPVGGLDDYRLAPFHLLAAEGRAFVDHDHQWHMTTLHRLAQADPQWIVATPYRVVSLEDVTTVAAAADWWLTLTGAGGEGMVVKPLSYIESGSKGLVQPAIKCRGREYLRIIYGPEYTTPKHLDVLRKRGLGAKRSLALREFALGIEALERFIAREPLRRVHECVFGVLALESEPVDPRL